MSNKKMRAITTMDRFSCPFIGLTPFAKIMSEEERKSLEEFFMKHRNDGRFKEYFDPQGNLNLPPVANEFKPFPCCSIQKGEILKCRFYQPLDEFYEKEEGSECMLLMQSKCQIMESLSTIEKNEMEMGVFDLQMDVLEAQRRELGLPPLEEDNEDEDEDGDGEGDGPKDNGGDSEVKEEDKIGTRS